MAFDISAYILAGYPCLYVRTTEQERALQEIVHNVEHAGLGEPLNVFVWKVTTGLYPYASDDPTSDQIDGSNDFGELMRYIATSDSGWPHKNRLYIVFNPKAFIDNNPFSKQAIRDAAYAIRTKGSHVIFVGAAFECPEELSEVITFIDFDLPTKEEIKTLFSSITDAYTESMGLDVSEDMLEKAAENATGLTRLKAENALALSIVGSRGVDINLLRKEKQLAIKQSGVLEYMPTDESFDTLGGFDNLKEHVKRRRRYFEEHRSALDFGLKPPKGLMLVGVPGCLGADVKVKLNRGNRLGGRYYSMEDAYHKFNGIPFTNGRGTKGWSKKCPTYIQCLCDGHIAYREIDSIVYSGVKERFLVETDMGRQIVTTEDHRFKIWTGATSGDGGYEEGFVPLKNLKVGDVVICMGTFNDDVTFEKEDVKLRKVVHSIPYHPTAWRHFIAGKNYKRAHFARLVVEAAMNNLDVDTFIDILRTDENKAGTLKYLPEGMAVHHLDGDSTKDTLDNLVVMTKDEHDRLHGLSGGSCHFNRSIMPVVDHIKSIVSVGVGDVYDICMKGVYPNFVAEGFVVHNSGKTLSAKTIASVLNLPLYRLDVGALFRGVVGSSEQATKEALSLLETVAPACLLIDEAEKLLAGLESSGKSDSGVTSRVIGSLLTWMSETKAPIYKIATCNTIRNLDGAMFRKGRWDEVFAVDLPADFEREQIFSIHLRKRGREVTNFDLTRLSAATEGFVGAEIEAVVDEGLYVAFDANQDVTTDILTSVASKMVPISKTDKENIDAFRRWMEGRATPVSSVKAVKAQEAKEALGGITRLIRSN